MIALTLKNTKDSKVSHFSDRSAIDMIARWDEVEQIPDVKSIQVRYLGGDNRNFPDVSDAYLYARELAEDERRGGYSIEEYDRFGSIHFKLDTQLKGIYDALSNHMQRWTSSLFTVDGGVHRMSLRLVNPYGYVVANNFDQIAKWVCTAMQIPNIFVDLPRKVQPETVEPEAVLETVSTSVTIDVLKVVKEIHELSNAPGNEVRIHELSSVLKYAMENNTKEVITGEPSEIPKAIQYTVKYTSGGGKITNTSVFALDEEQAAMLFTAKTGIAAEHILKIYEV